MMSIDSNRKEFILNLMEFPSLKRIDSVEGRTYRTPNGDRYESVTTFLKRFLDTTALDNWKKRVGEEEAKKISFQAAQRGSVIHELCEAYLLKKDFPEMMPIDRYHFSQIRKSMDSNVENIRAVETMLYSDELKLAGTADCVADWKGKLSIIDFKTSKRKKKLEYIEGYIYQITIYSIMFEELTGIAIDNGVICIVTDHEGIQIFTLNLKELKPYVKHKIKKAKRKG